MVVDWSAFSGVGAFTSIIVTVVFLVVAFGLISWDDHKKYGRRR